jgi:hypothetical protein
VDVDRPLHCYAYVEAPFDVVSRVLASDAAGVLQHATDDAAEQTDVLTHSLSVDVAGVELSREVRIEVGDFAPVGVARATVPLRWEATAARPVFPHVDAELEVAAVTFEPPLTQVTLQGTYVPPLGVLGAGVDALVLHRIADAAIHRFTHELADAIRRAVEALPDDERF